MASQGVTRRHAASRIFSWRHMMPCDHPLEILKFYTKNWSLGLAFAHNRRRQKETLGRRGEGENKRRGEEEKGRREEGEKGRKEKRGETKK